MEIIKNNIQKNHKIILENRNKICITGIDKVDIVSPSHFSCITQSILLSIEGEKLEITKLDVEQGNVELSGTINKLYYTNGKNNFIKRLFK